MTRSSTSTLLWLGWSGIPLDVVAASDVAVAADGSLVAVASGDEVEDWARRLCSAVGNQDLGDDIPGVQTTGLCPR